MPPNTNESSEGDVYQKAQAKAQSFIAEIDPELEVSVGERNVKVDTIGKEENRQVLVFSKGGKEIFHMSVVDTPGYLDEHFPEEVKKIYQKEANKTPEDDSVERESW